MMTSTANKRKPRSKPPSSSPKRVPTPSERAWGSREREHEPAASPDASARSEQDGRWHSAPGHGSKHERQNGGAAGEHPPALRAVQARPRQRESYRASERG